MLFLLSPAKTLDEKPARAGVARTEPVLGAEAQQLASALAALTPAALRTLLDVSAPLAELNHGRYASFASAAEKQAILAFNGPAYKALDAAALTPAQLDWVQRRLRILCGLYGVLSPLDAIKPYRLEMGAKLQTKAGRDLYAFWGAKVMESVRADMAQLPAAERCLVNVASAEYFQVVKPFITDAENLYTMVFHGATVHVKAARGAIVRYAALSGATRPEELRGFTGLQGEWRFVASSSSERSFVFERGAPAKPQAAPKAAARKAPAKRTAEAAEAADAEEQEAAPAKRGGRARRS
jgi:cytoplasmic iron level regulating protein YaaA (DUF328/UPF0246 family)